MSYTTTIPAGKIDGNELLDLVSKLNRLTKQSIRIESQFVVVTDDANISSIFDGLVGAILDGKPTATKQKKVFKAKSAGMTSHQVRIDATDEIISTQAFNKRIAAGEVAELTNVSNAKGEKLVVMDGKLVKGPQS